MHLAIWIFTLLLVGLWTLLAWGLGALLTVDGAWVAGLRPWLLSLPFGGWLESWFPEWLRLAQALLDLMQALLGWLGAAGPILVWVTWGIGAFVLMLLALSLLVVLIRKTMPPSPPAQPSQDPGRQPPPVAAA